MPLETSWFCTLSSQFLGDGWVLEAGAAAADGVGAAQARMAPAAATPALTQRWRLSTTDDGAYRLSTEQAGEGWYLTATGLRGGVVLQPQSAENASRQVWDATEQSDGWVQLRPRAFPGTWLESNHPLTGSALVDGAPLPLVMDNRGIPTGQRWKLSPVESISMSGAVKPVGDATSGAWGETGAFAALDASVSVRVVFVELDETAPVPADATKLVVRTVPSDPADGPLRTAVTAAQARLIAESTSVTEFAALTGGNASLVFSFDSDRVVVGMQDRFVTTDQVTNARKWDNPDDFAGRVAAALDEGKTDAKDKTTGYDVLAICLVKDVPGSRGGANSCKVRERTIIMSTDAYTDDYRIFLHELGHTFSLPDLYPLNGAGGHKVGPWDLMADARLATSMVGWHRLRAGWVDPGSPRITRIVLPVGGSARRVVLVPWSFASGCASVIVQPSDGATVPKSYGIELNGAVKGKVKDPATGEDKAMKADEGIGVVVYRVDASPATNRRQMEVVAREKIDDGDAQSKWDLFYKALLKQDVPLTVDGQFTVTLKATVLDRGFAVEIADVPAVSSSS